MSYKFFCDRCEVELPDYHKEDETVISMDRYRRHVYDFCKECRDFAEKLNTEYRKKSDELNDKFLEDLGLRK